MILTFINAFVSSPVHCLKPRPWGKHLIPAKGAASDMLRGPFSGSLSVLRACSPIVDLVKNLISMFFWMESVYEVPNPINEMVLKSPFDELMQDIGRNELVDVGSREI